MAHSGGIGDLAEAQIAHNGKVPSVSDEKSYYEKNDVETATIEANSEEAVLHNERDIATHVISVQDDQSLNPWTIRAFIIGIGLSAFGGVLGTLLRSCYDQWRSRPPS